MPIYDFRCKHCGYEFEDLIKMDEPNPEACPDCGAKNEIQKLISKSEIRVELTGRDLITKLRAEGKAMAKEAKRNDTLAADLYGLK